MGGEMCVSRLQWSHQAAGTNQRGQQWTGWTCERCRGQGISREVEEEGGLGEESVGSSMDVTSPSSGMAVTPGTKALKDPGTHRGERPDLLWDPPVKGALSDNIWFLSTSHMQAGDMREPKTAPP